ncbi:tol-pal system-associated acyl-CoA thioesterase [Nitrogeniibacter aestuarii]|uniref:tol-pal system-associated acyl-CoA thioesterase n=1 Tax=Nitrogeniibacter aestuarii TaxID=2815343 RepID=UPI001D115A00|nr:tol-pal system-associated acyl-CoA thioesterase [Nitrogeniibacter aestuarii]
MQFGLLNAVRETRLPLRIYYEDTDAGGVVYYANYWKFCERGRTEWLRALGFEQQTLLDEAGLAFVVRKVEGDYLRPARLDDEIVVNTVMADARRASLKFTQYIERGTERLFTATVSIACLDLASGRPAAIPEHIRKTLEAAA